MDGSEREVEADSMVTLQVEVNSPSPNYTLRWNCTLEDHPGASCFEDPTIWTTFTTTTTVADDGVLSRIYHLWDIMEDGQVDMEEGEGHSGPEEQQVGDEENVDGVYAEARDSPGDSHAQNGGDPSSQSRGGGGQRKRSGPSFQRGGPNFKKSDPSTRSDVRSSNPRPMTPPPQLPHKTHRYVETISIPTNTLVTSHSRFRFTASVRYHFKTDFDTQLIVLRHPRDK